MLDIEIKGLADLNQMLQSLPAKIEVNVLRAALKTGAQVIEAEAKRLVPVGKPNSVNKKRYGATEGSLRDSIRVSMSSKKGIVKARLRAGNKTAWYAHLVEFGTKRHLIKATDLPASPFRKNKTISLNTLNKRIKKGSLRIGDVYIGDSVQHPGARAIPFMRRAFHTQHRAALEAMADYMRRRIPKEIKKEIKKAGR